MASLTLVTSNPHKVAEISEILGVVLSTQAFDIPEIQSFSLEEMVRCKVLFARDRVQGPVLVEDVSFGLSVLKGFPGPFIKFWEQAGVNDVAVDVVEKLGNARAVAYCAVGYADKKQVLYVERKVEGTFVSRRGTEGFGFDFYFIPDGETQTYAEMGLLKKNLISHRRQAWEVMRNVLEEKHLF